jgi:hypothetical protein
VAAMGTAHHAACRTTVHMCVLSRPHDAVLQAAVSTGLRAAMQLAPDEELVATFIDAACRQTRHGQHWKCGSKQRCCLLMQRI